MLNVGGEEDITLAKSRSVLPKPDPALLSGASLLLDLDGTLLELVDRPDDVVADDDLRALLLQAANRLEGRLAIISGRSLAQMDDMLGQVAERIALSGSHGCEHRWNGVLAHPVRPAALDTAAHRLRARFGQVEGAVIEDKSFGVALHYRLAPAIEPDAARLARGLAEELGLALQAGKMMVELRVPGGDKGAAVQRLMGRAPMKGTVPIFVGDDVTDEDGFVAARALGGAGILVGDPRPTEAHYALPDPNAVREWLAAAVE